MHHRSLSATGLVSLLALGTAASCAEPACLKDAGGCKIPTMAIDGTPRLSLTKDVTLQLSITKQFVSSPSVLRIQQSNGSQNAQLSLRLFCDDLTACAVTVASDDLKASKFAPGEAKLAVLDAPDGNQPLASMEQTLRVDDPQFVFVPDIEGGGDGWPLPDVPPGWQNLGLRWASTVPTVGNAQGIFVRGAIDTGNYDVNSLYVATYNAISRDFTLSARANGVIGKSAFYSDPSFLWHLSRVNGAAEEYNFGKIDLRDINGPDITLRVKTALTAPPALLAVTPDGVSAAIADGTGGVSHFSTGGAEAPVSFSSDGRQVVAMQTFQLVNIPELAVVNADRIRLFDPSNWQPLAASGALTGLTSMGPVSALAAADLNNDGLTDLMVASGLTLQIWAQRSDRTFGVVNYLQIPGVDSPCPDNPAVKVVRTVRYLASGQLDGQPGVDLLVTVEDMCEQATAPIGARLFVFLHGT